MSAWQCHVCLEYEVRVGSHQSYGEVLGRNTEQNVHFANMCILFFRCSAIVSDPVESTFKRLFVVVVLMSQRMYIGLGTVL